MVVLQYNFAPALRCSHAGLTGRLYQTGLGMLVRRVAFVPPKISDHLETAKFCLRGYIYKPDKQTKKMIVGNRKSRMTHLTE